MPPSGGRLLRFCSICVVKSIDCGIPVISIAKTRYPETLCSLFSIDRRLPKLNVIGFIFRTSREFGVRSHISGALDRCYGHVFMGESATRRLTQGS
jgi:hypothetical protein